MPRCKGRDRQTNEYNEPIETLTKKQTHNNIYKNEAVRDYVFAATSKGLYRSDDLGQNWIKVRDGNYITVY